MKKIHIISLLVLSIIIVDRFVFMPNRVNDIWEFEHGYFIGDPISFNENMKMENNYSLSVFKNNKKASFYLLGCYFGSLYLLNKKDLGYNKYCEFGGSKMWN